MGRRTRMNWGEFQQRQVCEDLTAAMGLGHTLRDLFVQAHRTPGSSKGLSTLLPFLSPLKAAQECQTMVHMWA